MSVNPIQRSQGRLRPNVPRGDELADGVAAPSGEHDPATAVALAAVTRAPSGKVADPESAALLGRLGGKARARKAAQLATVPALVRGLGLRDVSAPSFLPYLDDGHDFAAVHAAELAQTVGGGFCTPSAASMVQSAALQLAASRWLFARGETVPASRLADASRANLLSARDECARAAEARERACPSETPLERIRREGREATEAARKAREQPAGGPS
jgi:hypothetical protein